MIRVDLIHLRFDQHKELHRSTCFKKNDKCRANLPVMVCNKPYLFDNEHILAQAMKEVNWYRLSQECPVTEVMQFFVIPKRAQACQFLNQHSIPISELISCNTNVCMVMFRASTTTLCIKPKTHRKKTRPHAEKCARR